MNEIQWKPKAAKQLLKLHHGAQVAIRDEVSGKLSVFPACSGVKRLVNHEYGYRLRVGNYRVFFDFEGGAACIVRIEQVRKRDERTY
jgi:mRNA-degrading endonuclease RelE of RelBE toxin-antitoxin system